MGQQQTYNSTICSPICGDGVKIDIEECEDSNLINNDGCSSDCKLEDGFEC